MAVVTDNVPTPIIKFYSTKDTYGYFSNFSRHPFELDGEVWKTSEHYYQAHKFTPMGQPLSEWSIAIRDAATPMEAAKMGRDRNHPPVDGWDQIKEDVMRRALKAKFDAHESIREGLIKTGTSVLVESTVNDSYWADGGDGTGLNRLGVLLMELRDYYTNK